MKWVRIILLIGLLGIGTQGVGLSQNRWPVQLSGGQVDRGLMQETDFFPPSLRATGSTYTNRLSSDVLPDTLGSHSSEFPSPRSVLFKSMMVPGWGQIENDQIWKVPLIYGMFAGVGIYTSYLNNRYKDYRAAYYNSHQTEESDYKFGPTPDYLVGVNPSQLQSNRNSLRNQRDFMFIVMGLAYGLNALDAYIFAHMRSFDVSEDLSASTYIGPAVLEGPNPGIRVRINLY